jgi:YD repeat-containing protein
MKRLFLALTWALGAAQLPAMAGTLTRTSAFEYDPATGLLVKEIIEPGDSNLCLVTEYAYDAFGNKVSATTRNCNGSAGSHPGVNSEAAAPAAGSPAVIEARTSGNNYGADGRFPLTSSNALGHAETKAYDARFGGVTRLTGPNALATEWKYDGFGRKVLEKRADGTGTRWEYVLCSTVTGGCPGNGVVTAVYFVRSTPVAAPIDLTAGTTGAQNGPTATVYFDALNREIRAEAQGFDGSGTAPVNVTLTRYDALGRVAEKSRPFAAGQDANAKFVRFEYDVLGRVTAQVEPDSVNPAGNRTTFAYNGLSATVTDAKGNTRTTVKNSQGQVVSVTDASGALLSHAYDPFGNLSRTTDPLGNVTQLGYDLRGRKVSMADPDMGSWSYEYNVLGELVRQTDAKGQVTTMTYDKLGRMTKRTESDLVSNWYYDQYKDGTACAKGIGKLCEAETGFDYRRKHSYDALGRPAATATTIDNLAVPYVASTT